MASSNRTAAELGETSLARLEQCLRAERSAVAAYDRALELTDAQDFAWTVLELRVRHDARARSIVRHLTARGAAPPSTTLPRRGAGGEEKRRLGPSLLDAFEALEEHLLAFYERHPAGLDLATRRFIERCLAPDQKTTCALLECASARVQFGAAPYAREVA